MQATFINRGSTQAFASWSIALGTLLGHDLTLMHKVAVPPTRPLILTAKTVYGAELQTPTVVLRFRDADVQDGSALSRLIALLAGTTRYAPTNLPGVLPPFGKIPRFYSVASSASDTEVEICVRKQTGGACSTYLCDLEIGDSVHAFARPNSDFSRASGAKPVIMVSAGTGIVPFIGLIRANRARRPFHLFWGGRSPDSDFLYHHDLDESLGVQHLASLATAFSRVQDSALCAGPVRHRQGLRC